MRALFAFVVLSLASLPAVAADPAPVSLIGTPCGNTNATPPQNIVGTVKMDNGNKNLIICLKDKDSAPLTIGSWHAANMPASTDASCKNGAVAVWNSSTVNWECKNEITWF